MKKKSNPDKRQLFSQSICSTCKWSEYWNSDVVWFICNYPEWKVTETNEPIKRGLSCQYWEKDD
jgi:hypothetical protein